MQIQAISNINFKSSVCDFVTNETPELVKTKQKLDAELKQIVPNDRKNRTYIQYFNDKGLDVCYSQPYTTAVNEKGQLDKFPLKNAPAGAIRVDLTHRVGRKSNGIQMPYDAGYVGTYDKNGHIEFNDMNKACNNLWRPIKTMYFSIGTMIITVIAAIGIAIAAVNKKCTILPQKNAVELIKKVK